MNELRFTAEVLERLRAAGGPYDERAYLFVLAGIEYLQARLPARRHLTAAELARACRHFALEQYGLLARTVLEHWGIRRTADLGRVVYTLVEIGLLVTQPGDSEEDFAELYAFDEAFDTSYVWQGLPGS